MAGFTSDRPPLELRMFSTDDTKSQSEISIEYISSISCIGLRSPMTAMPKDGRFAVALRRHYMLLCL